MLAALQIAVLEIKKPRVKLAVAPKLAEVRQPKAAAPAEKVTSVAPKTAKAAAPADQVVISSSDSDSDAPISVPSSLPKLKLLKLHSKGEYWIRSKKWENAMNTNQLNQEQRDQKG